MGEGGYQVGNFSPVWTEWNGKYRDCLRDFWRGEDQTLGEFAAWFTGSSDLYENTSRLPYASFNLITAHDGFTLNDLVSYNKTITRPTARKAVTEKATTVRGTAVRRGPPKTRM